MAGLVIAVISVLVLEVCLDVCLTHWMGRGRIFRTDERTGWWVRSHLDLKRRNADGGTWSITTGPGGLRGPEAWAPQARTRVLILGDSFAFGEDVDLDQRFDTRMAEELPGFAFVNLGVMGFGTDQALLSGRSRFPDLRRGDVLILVTFRNDFQDNTRRRQWGRAKPCFEQVGSRLVLHPPRIGLGEILRERSYIATILSSWIEGWARQGVAERPATTAERELYAALVRSETRPLRERGVHVVIAHHGSPIAYSASAAREEHTPPMRQWRALFEGLAAEGFDCVDLDASVGAAPIPSPYLIGGGGHWNREGHHVVAEELTRALRRLSVPRRAP